MTQLRRYLVEHPEKREGMGRNARRKAQTCFDSRMQAETMIKIYEELLVGMPDYAKLYYQLANLKATLNRQDEGFYYYGYYYWYEGDLISAKQHFSKAVTLLPQENQKKSDADNMLNKISRFEKEKL